jgi:hypothetical protein
MNQKPAIHDALWIASEIFYYLGLVLAVLFMPALTLALWVMSLVDKADPNYLYILIAWVLSALLFLASTRLKNYIYSKKNSQDTN